MAFSSLAQREGSPSTLRHRLRETATSRKTPIVVSRHGRYRFQTGLVTATLLRKGVPMGEAQRMARAVRDEVQALGRVDSDTLEALVAEQLTSYEGDLEPAPTAKGTESNPPITIHTPLGPTAFSKGILVRDLVAIGLDAEEASRQAMRMQEWLVARDQDEIGLATHDRRLLRSLHREHGRGPPRRLRLMRWIQNTPRPVVVLIGGATGTGKSTLALELAHRLGIPMVTSTDMIREAMRTVLNPAVLPGLFDHSFRGMVQGGHVLSDPRERVLAGFRQQADQVAVGVRAVVRRAYRERSSLILEGTHLLPPFERYLPRDAEIDHAGIILAVPEEARHLSRFPRRARSQSHREADAYLDAFQSVRWIHDDLLAASEDHEVLVLSSEGMEETTRDALDLLSQALPVERRTTRPTEPPRHTEAEAQGIRTLMLILDGLADEPSAALGGATPLAASEIPTLRPGAAAGGPGLRPPAPPAGRRAASTHEGLWALLGGQGAADVPGRGLFEALGQQQYLPRDSVVLRGNLATLDEQGLLVDRRAGRIRDGLPELLAGLEDVKLKGAIRGMVLPGLEHRVLVVLHGPGLSSRISDTDPRTLGEGTRPLTCRPLVETPEAARAAEALRQLLAVTAEHLADHPVNASRAAAGLPLANTVITRGAAALADRPGAHRHPDRSAMVAACLTTLGIGRALGMQTVATAEMTANVDTDLDAKLAAAGRLLAEWSFVVVHVKGLDILSHDCRPEEKCRFLEAIDAALGRFLATRTDLIGSLRVVVTADHPTSSTTGEHMADPVPLLLARWEGLGDDAVPFDEVSAERGALGLLQPGELDALLWVN